MCCPTRRREGKWPRTLTASRQNRRKIQACLGPGLCELSAGRDKEGGDEDRTILGAPHGDWTSLGSILEMPPNPAHLRLSPDALSASCRSPARPGFRSLRRGPAALHQPVPAERKWRIRRVSCRVCGRDTTGTRARRSRGPASRTPCRSLNSDIRKSAC